jgi:hypothetical protein
VSQSEPTLALPKLQWSLVARDAVFIFAAFEAVLSIAAALIGHLSLPAADVLWIAGASAVATALGSAVARYWGLIMPLLPTSLATEDTDTISLTTAQSYLWDLLDALEPTLKENTVSFLAGLAGFAATALAWVDPHALFTPSDKIWVAIAGLVFTLGVFVVHKLTAAKVKVAAAREASNLAMVHANTEYGYAELNARLDSRNFVDRVPSLKHPSLQDFADAFSDPYAPDGGNHPDAASPVVHDVPPITTDSGSIAG